MDIKERIRELAVSVSIDLNQIPAHRCWIDARQSCPYGKPEGQYLLRPEGFCGEGCPTWDQHRTKLGLSESDVTDRLQSAFLDNAVSLASQIREAADSFPEGSPEQLALKLAGDIVHDSETLNVSILLQEDAP